MDQLFLLQLFCRLKLCMLCLMYKLGDILYKFFHKNWQER